jgi:putative spermidine/putrescine transport system permease protein
MGADVRDAPTGGSSGLAGKIGELRQGRVQRIMDRLSHGALWVAGTVSMIFLLAPVVVVVLASFNRAPALNVPPRRWSLSSYAAISPALYEAFVLSLQLAAMAAALSVVLAVPASFWLARTRGLLPRVVDTFFRSPLQVPRIVLGMSLYQAYVLYQLASGVSLRGTFIGLLAAHIVLVTPYVIATCVASIEGRGQDLELAAASLGAAPFRVFVQVSLPAIRQALIASAVLGTLISFDDVPLSLFLAGAGTTPLPVQLFALSEQNLTPALYAAATLTVAFSIALTVLLERFVGLRKALQR